jgi:hypothetical protein
VTLRIARRHRQTVTDKSVFWVARPYVSGALFSGFTVDRRQLAADAVRQLLRRTRQGCAGAGRLSRGGARGPARLRDRRGAGEALRQLAGGTPAWSTTSSLVRITYCGDRTRHVEPDDPIRARAAACCASTAAAARWW